MALLHTYQFWQGAVSLNTYTTVYTVPSGYRATITDIQVRNTYAGSNQLFVAVGGMPTSVSLWAADRTAGSSGRVSMWQVAMAGQTIRVAAQYADIYITISGKIYTV